MARNDFDGRSDGPIEMSTGTLDRKTAERLLRGALPPEEAPPGYEGVVALLQAARTEARTTTSARTGETVTAMLAAIEAHGPVARPVRVAPRRSRRALAALGSAGVLAVFGSLTAAGALPAVAQDHVSGVLAKVGIDVPRADTRDPGSNPNAPDADDGGVGADPEDKQGTTSNHGTCVSEVAGSGGEVVSDVARSDCGKDPKPPQPDDPGSGNGPPDGAPPGQVKPDQPHPTPPPQSNSGGSGTSGNGQANVNGQANTNPEAPGQANDK